MTPCPKCQAPVSTAFCPACGTARLEPTQPNDEGESIGAQILRASGCDIRDLDHKYFRAAEAKAHELRAPPSQPEPPKVETPALEAWQREEGQGPWDDLREAFLSDLSRATKGLEITAANWQAAYEKKARECDVRVRERDEALERAAELHHELGAHANQEASWKMLLDQLKGERDDARRLLEYEKLKVKSGNEEVARLRNERDEAVREALRPQWGDEEREEFAALVAPSLRETESTLSGAIRILREQKDEVEKLRAKLADAETAARLANWRRLLGLDGKGET